MRLATIVLAVLITASELIVSADDAPVGTREAYDTLVRSLDHKRIAADYPKAVQNLDSSESKNVIAALRTLGATEEPAVIPWIVPLLDSDDSTVRVWAGLSLYKVVSLHELKRRDLNHPERVAINPRGPDDLDLSPLAWVIQKMLQSDDDGSTHSYAASMIGYLNLSEFEPDLRQLLKSRHPAVTNSAKYALELIGAEVNGDFSDQEKALARQLGESFGELFRKGDDDNLALLLLPQDAIDDVLNPNVLDDSDVGSLYGKMVAANTRRFREFRAVFADLTKTDVITFQPGHMAKSEFYADGVRLMKNSYVTLAYANRIQVKIKIEEIVFVDDQCWIVEID